jgi:hypothetical protein
MPALAAELSRQIGSAIDLARAGEIARVNAIPGGLGSPRFDAPRLEYVYELAFLRMFVAWEIFLEQTFLRYLCGYVSSAYGPQAMVAGVYYPTLAAAEAAVLGGQAYKLWHNPIAVEGRSRQFFSLARHETVMAAARIRITHMAAVRHRVAHGQEDAAVKFDVATQYWVGHRYKGSRPGRFLRDYDTAASPPRRWLDTLGNELSGLSAQIS